MLGTNEYPVKLLKREQNRVTEMHSITSEHSMQLDMYIAMIFYDIAVLDRMTIYYTIIHQLYNIQMYIFQV